MIKVTETTRLKKLVNQLENGVNIFVVDQYGQEYAIEKVEKDSVHDDDNNWYYRIVVDSVDGCCIKR